MIVTVLGSCGNQTALREGVSLLVEDDSQKNGVLIDTGPGVVAALGRCGRMASDITNVILTHKHGDHVCGYAYFVWQRHYERLGKDTPAADLHVYALEDVATLAKQMLDGCYGKTTGFPFEVTYRNISGGDKIKTGDMRISVVGANHAVPSLSCVITDGTGKVAYSSDTLPVPEFIQLAESADLLLHEGMWTESSRDLADRTKHSTAGDAGSVAAEAGVKELALVHIFPSILGKEGTLLCEARRKFSGPISIPHDGSVYIV